MPSHTQAAFSLLPESGFIRQAQLLPNIVPVSSTTWWRWINAGKAPRPHKLSERVTAWKVQDIREFLDARGTTQVESNA